jgi:hypothetical protein
MGFPIPTFQELVEQFVGHRDIQQARRDIMERARELGIADQIPDNWNPDGTLKVIPDEEPPMRSE